MYAHSASPLLQMYRKKPVHFYSLFLVQSERKVRITFLDGSHSLWKEASQLSQCQNDEACHLMASTSNSTTTWRNDIQAYLFHFQQNFKHVEKKTSQCIYADDN
ncbi:hypothetical protein CDL12_03333 [Handroanthus impetiginosus]|uniref:Uncharacterized protein n=1 Tax=Handroanthus impetiginosus TaxID=429701 RepID=A0A2G9I2F2_9LAMI|nr:hypothetical protein CDL12_03333 [Handroanthus impetiginosus]